MFELSDELSAITKFEVYAPPGPTSIGMRWVFTNVL
jgi:hypothetical protein